MDDFAQTWLAALRHDAAKQRMFAQEFQFIQQRQAEAFGGGRIVTGDVANQTGEVLVGDLGYEDLESHDWSSLSTCSSGMSLQRAVRMLERAMKLVNRRCLVVPALLVLAGLTCPIWHPLAVQFHKLAMRAWDTQADWAARPEHLQALVTDVRRWRLAHNS